MVQKHLPRCLIVLLLCACGAHADVVLFDGKDTAGWKMAGPGGFDLKDGELVSHGGMGLFWHEKELGDCIVSLDYKVNNENANSGVFVRFPDPGNDPWVAVRKGHEIQILGKTTGDVYDTQKNSGAEPKPAGEWNHLEIKLVGKHYTVKLNDKVVNEFDSKDRPLRGRVGIQNHDDKSIVTFKNIKVQELKEAATKEAALSPVSLKGAKLDAGLVGEYFKNVEKVGEIAAGKQPFLVRVDKHINFRPSNGQFYKTKLSSKFGVRWTGYVTIDKPGAYSFIVRSDDESRLSLNDKVLIESEKWDIGKDYEKTVQLKRGTYALKLEFHQGPGGASCQLQWQTPGDEKARPVPADVLGHASGAEEKIAWDRGAWEKTRWTRKAWAREFGETFDKMDYGPFFSASIQVAEKNIANKGIAISLTKGDDATVCFDTELLRYAGGWVGGFLDNNGVVFNGAHGVNPGPDGEVIFQSPVVPGIASASQPKADPRPRPYGPLPRDWGRYKGLYLSGDRVVLSYTVGARAILESPSLVKAGEQPVFVRTIRSDESDQPAMLLVCKDEAGVAVAMSPEISEKVVDGARWAVIPPSDRAMTHVIAVSRAAAGEAAKKMIAQKPIDLVALTEGGAARWTEKIETKGEVGKLDGPYAVDTLTVPESNPYYSWMRFGGLDFFSDGRAAVTTWSGDVWVVSGIDEKLEKLSWKRYATGLFQPLGLRIVNDEVYALGRDQITKLVDVNKDGEADFYQCFNNDCEVTPSFHEFAFDLQTDKEGNFYFAKAGPVRPGGRGWEILSAHNGTMMKVAKDGSKLEVFATGVRAPNGMCAGGPNDEITVADNEGTWTPTCRLSLVKKGMFLGVTDLAKRELPPTSYDKPICWLPHGEVDNSSGGQVWVTPSTWGPFKDRLLHLSYGKCALFLVDYEFVDGQVQGGVVQFPLQFVSGICRSRFNPVDKQLYVAGLRGWQTTAAKDACLQRVRFTGKPVKMPTRWRVKEDGVEVAFTTELDSAAASDLNNYSVEAWNYLWTSDYGSPEVSVADPKEKSHDPVEVTKVVLSPDKKTIKLTLDGIEPVMQMKIQMKLKSADGTAMEYSIYNTINKVPGQAAKTASDKTASTQAAAER